MSSRVDDRVEQLGEPVTLERVSDFDTDSNGHVIDDSVERESETVRAIVSDPREEDEQRTDGRLSTGALRLTVPSDTDIRGDRAGRPDRVIRPARNGWGEASWGGDPWGGREPGERMYVVVDIRDDRHPLTGTRKLTVLVDELGGYGGGV